MGKYNPVVYTMHMLTKYIALLRGINVGGNHKVPMAELRMLFESMGFSAASTYINSGNVVFESAAQPDEATIRRTLAKHFGFDIEVLVLTAAHVIAIADAIPNEWMNDKEQKTDVAYLFHDVDAPTIMEQLAHKPEIETMMYVPGAVIMNISRKNQTRGSLLKMMGTPLYKQMTIRNVSTARKLAELVQ